MSTAMQQPRRASTADNSNFTVTIHHEPAGGEPFDIHGSLPETIRLDSSSTWEAPMANGILGMLPGSINGLLRMYGVKPATQAMTMQVWQGTSESDLTMDLVFRTYSDPIQDIRTPLLQLLRLNTPSVDDNGVINSPGPSLAPEAAAKLVVGAAAMSAGIAGTAANLVGELGGSLFAALGGALTGGNYKPDPAKTKDSSSQPMSQGALDELYKKVPSMDEVQSMIRNPISIQIGNYLYFKSVVIVNVQPESDLSFLDGLTAYPNVVRVSVTFRPLFMITADDWKEIFIDPNNLNDG